MAIKIGLENAFEKIRHNYIYLVLEKFVFSPKFVKLIEDCISLPWISPLVNGRPT